MSVGPAEAPSASTRPLPSWPVFEPDEVAAAAEVLRSGKVNYWTGPQGRAFEDEFARYVGSQYGLAVANGTLALELALFGLGIGPGDEVIVPSRTFIATASAVVARGARPVCADVDLHSGNLSAETIEPVLTSATKAIIVVHLGGWPVDADNIVALSRSRNIAVIEDCAQSHGAAYKGRRVGSLGDVAAFSFCQDKIMTTGGEGGMVTTSDGDLWERMWSYKDHGKHYGDTFRTDHPPGFRWLHNSFGTNFRLTEMQSVIGRVQLAKLQSWVERRRRNAAQLAEALAHRGAVNIPLPGPNSYHAHYRLYGYIDPSRLRPGWTRDRIVEAISTAGVPCGVGSCGEIWRERAFPAPWRPTVPLPNAAQLAQTSLCWLVHPTLEREDISSMARVVNRVLDEALG